MHKMRCVLADSEVDQVFASALRSAILHALQNGLR